MVACQRYGFIESMVKLCSNNVLRDYAMKTLRYLEEEAPSWSWGQPRHERERRQALREAELSCLSLLLTLIKIACFRLRRKERRNISLDLKRRLWGLCCSFHEPRFSYLSIAIALLQSTHVPKYVSTPLDQESDRSRWRRKASQVCLKSYC